MNFSHPTQARMELYFTLLLLACGAGLLVLAYVRISQHVIEARQTLLAVEEHARALESYRKQALRVQELLETRAGDIARLQALMIDPERPLNFIEEVEGLAKKTGTTVTLDAQESQRNRTPLSLRATIEGKEARVRSMLSLLALLPYRIDIEQVFFQRTERKDAFVRITVPFTIRPL